MHPTASGQEGAAHWGGGIAWKRAGKQAHSPQNSPPPANAGARSRSAFKSASFVASSAALASTCLFRSATCPSSTTLLASSALMGTIWLPLDSPAIRPPPTVLNSEMAIFGAGATHTVRSCTEKRRRPCPCPGPVRHCWSQTIHVVGVGGGLRGG